jgi:hypothetical protein
VEHVAEVSHSKVGRIVTHMVLSALPWDSAVRLQAKPSMISTGNLAVVPTMWPLRLRLR